MEKKAKIKLKREVSRKLFHLTILVVIILYYFSNKPTTLLWCAIFLLGFVLSDIIRVKAYYLFPLRKMADTVTRPFEKRALGAAVYFTIGALTTVFLFEKIIAIAAVTIAAAGDGMAAVTGTAFGRHKISKESQKTVEGAIGAFITSLGLGIFFFLETPLLWPIIISLVAATVVVSVDLVELPTDDNLMLSIILGFAITYVHLARFYLSDILSLIFL
ncbi:MAG: diacylglycerol/polyprenol kinase family protein [Candidatus Sifarchaeia archaeon]